MNAKKQAGASANKELAAFIGKVVSFNNSLKLFHWQVSGAGSYATHIALDQALEVLLGVTDRIVETTFAMKGNLTLVVPETPTPGNIIQHTEGFYKYVESSRELFTEDFSQSIFDDYQEGVQQLLYRLKRLE